MELSGVSVRSCLLDLLRTSFSITSTLMKGKYHFIVLYMSLVLPLVRYGGIPPSWSTSLASAGFTEEEITAIQARRLPGARSPPDLRYLYTDRPNSPAVTTNFPFPGQSPVPIQQSQSQPAYTSAHPYSNPSAAVFSPPPSQSTGVPILTHPMPRSTSLPRLAPDSTASAQNGSFAAAATGRPPVPIINASISATVSRVPPPKRKPPMSPSMAEDDAQSAGHSQKGHKPNQASSSTMAYSTDSHAMTSSYVIYILHMFHLH